LFAPLDKEVDMEQQMYRGIRKRSAGTLCGLPLLDIAMGPDPEKGEMRGHARGIIAIGDIATGGIALGGVAAGIIAFGGLGVGIVSFGGLAFGLLAIGGLAVGGIAAGGGAIGCVAIGGGAVGYYAFGGAAFGKHVISAMQRSPEAVEFFKHWFPFLPICGVTRRNRQQVH
jgi:hypothetical protein